ncbi:hypothetical protein [Kitasatospora sp. NPDC050543]|uniref:hypothetical protein n=1 Tax=Kitasatospora sp. NPDC050543 TaxID=3364054 RepID=UPI00378E1CCC
MPAPTAQPASGLLSRAGRALLRRRAPRPAPPRPDHETQLRALLAVLDDAVAAQRLADQVVAACGELGPVPGSIAEAGARQLTIFNQLAVRMRELVVDGDVARLHERASRLLAYHLWMIHNSLALAFASQRGNCAIEAARLRVNGLGAPADALQALRDDVALRLAGDLAAAPAQPRDTSRRP